MDRKNFLFKRRLRYMAVLVAAFFAILLTFDFILFAAAQGASYAATDMQLIEASEKIMENEDGALNNFLNGKEIVYSGHGSSYVISYKIFLILRDEKGEIINSEYLQSFDYMTNIRFNPLDTKSLKIEKAQRNGFTRSYRTYILKIISSDNKTYYIQMATDVTDIQRSLDIIVNVCILCTCASMIIVVIVGWYLSKTLVKGVVEAWEHQDEFISYASHEIRSPLAVIHSSLELLLETPGKRIIDRSELITNSLMETSRLRKMTNNLLEMVKLQSAQLQPHYEMVNMKELVEGFIEPFVFQAEGTGKNLTYSVGDGIIMAGDVQLLTELMVILLENALKYTMQDGDITLKVEKHGANAVITVADTGIGITDEAMTKVFSRFYRDERHQAKADGSGLGLYLASLIAQSHKGRIEALHNKPCGTVFKVTIPMTSVLKNN